MWSETRRPGYLADVIGHTEVKERLTSYLSTKPYTNTILLHGPPGIGKTTIALASARTCGFEPLEINASQSMRSFEDVQKLIQTCKHTRSIVSLIRGIEKTTCLILDEVDGSDPHAQRKLAEWMVGPERTIPVIMTCNEVPRIFKNQSKIEPIRCFPPKPTELSGLFSEHGQDIAKLAKRFKHDVRRILQFFQYGESDTLPTATLPSECSYEVGHILRQQIWNPTDPILEANKKTSSETKPKV